MIISQWKKTNLANIYRDVITKNDLNYTAFIDFKPYAPSADAPASFIARIVHNTEDKPIDVLAYKMPIERMNAAPVLKVCLKKGQSY
jgi:methyl-accepting chemotaxis protein